MSSRRAVPEPGRPRVARGLVLPDVTAGALGRIEASHRGALLAVAVVAAALFAAFAAAVEHGGALVRLDERVSRWVASEMPAWAEWAARPFSWLGGWIGVVAITAILLGELVRRRRWATVALVAAVLVGSQLAQAGLKQVFDRARPSAGSAVPLPSSPSFPSGHATTAGAFFGLLAVFAVVAAPPGRLRVAAAAAGVALALAIAGSRVVLNVHFVADVLAGLALGVAWLAACMLAVGRRGGAPAPATADGRREPPVA